MLWKYVAFLIALAFVAPLPRKAGYFIARIVADLSFLSSKRAKKNLSENLRNVLGPDASEDLINHCALEVSRNMSRNIFDLINMPRLDPQSLEKPISLDGWEHMEEALSRGKG